MTNDANIAEARRNGLAQAVALASGNDAWLDYAMYELLVERVLETAGRFTRFLLAHTNSLSITVSSLTFQQANPSQSHPTQYTTHIEGDTTVMSVTLTDTEKVSLTVEPEDTKGAPTTDSTLSWSESSGGTVVTLQPSADGTSCEVVAGMPGTSTVTVTDGTLSGTEVVTVTAGPVATLVVTAGTPTAQ